MLRLFIFRQQLKILNKKVKTIYGGQFDKQQLKICPTIVKVESEKNTLIKEELFSSILPILALKNLESILKIIQKSPKPLAIYIFGGSNIEHEKISNITSSGSICINDVIIPVITANLPFGGVGQSGMGKFHGEAGFKNFSNQKSITYRSNLFDVNLRYPPYSKIIDLINFIFKI